jgi:hypothetical protein
VSELAVNVSALAVGALDPGALAVREGTASRRTLTRGASRGVITWSSEASPTNLTGDG